MEPVIARQQTQEIDRVMPVIGESATEIRVAVEDDDARLALWIDRRDTWQTVLVPIQLADREGRVARSTGAWITTGASIDVAFGKDRVRHVTLRDPDVAVEGWVPETVLGNVWLDAKPPSRARDPRPQTKFVARATLRARPDRASPIVAVVLDDGVRGFVISRHAWNEVEILRPHAKLRGFVQTSELRADDDEINIGGTSGGHGFGMSHAHRLVIPAGTCLFDKPTGEVVGVQIKESERYGERDSDVDKWSRVYVDSPWAVLGFFVHDTGSDPTLPVWESCARH